MTKFFKTLIAAAIGAGTLGLATANAAPRPDFCDVDHDHRSHAANYYNHYDHDRYYRAGPYRGSGVSLTIRVGDNDRYDRYDRRDRRYNDRRYNDRRYDGRRNGYRGDRGRIVHREVFNTRHRARIVLTEEVVRTRRGPRLICNIRVRGPEAGYVSNKRLRRIARNQCSSRARVNIYS